jgi:hypothetical protein
VHEGTPVPGGASSLADAADEEAEKRQELSEATELFRSNRYLD